MIFKRKKREESDWWKGLKSAEDLYQDGCTYEGKDDIGCQIFCTSRRWGQRVLWVYLSV